MCPLCRMMVIAVSSSRLNVAAFTPRAGGIGGSLGLCFSRAMGFVRSRESRVCACEGRSSARMMHASRFETQVSKLPDPEIDPKRAEPARRRDPRDTSETKLDAHG